MNNGYLSITYRNGFLENGYYIRRERDRNIYVYTINFEDGISLDDLKSKKDVISVIYQEVSKNINRDDFVVCLVKTISALNDPEPIDIANRLGIQNLNEAFENKEHMFIGRGNLINGGVNTCIPCSKIAEIMYEKMNIHDGFFSKKIYLNILYNCGFKKPENGKFFEITYEDFNNKIESPMGASMLITISKYIFFDVENSAKKLEIWEQVIEKNSIIDSGKLRGMGESGKISKLESFIVWSLGKSIIRLNQSDVKTIHLIRKYIKDMENYMHNNLILSKEDWDPDICALYLKN